MLDSLCRPVCCYLSKASSFPTRLPKGERIYFYLKAFTLKVEFVKEVKEIGAVV